MTAGQGTIDAHSDDVSTTQGGFNLEWAGGSLHCGYHKSGYARGPALRFINPGIPAGSTINSATMTGNVFNATGTLSVVSAIKLLIEDGKWEATSRSDGWESSISPADWRVHLVDVATQLVTTGDIPAAVGGPVIEGDVLGIQNKRIPQGVTITAAGTITKAEVALGGSFISPGADPIHVEIWSDASGVPGSLLATSDTRPASDIAPKIWNEARPLYDFDFSVPEQIVVGIGEKYHVVMRSVVSTAAAHPHLGTRNYAYAGGNIGSFGESPNGGFDIHSYMHVNDWRAIASTGSVSWTIPTTLGLKTSPSVVSLIEAHIAKVGYTSSDPIPFRLDITGGSGEAIFQGYPNALRFVLDIDWTAPAIIPPTCLVSVSKGLTQNITNSGGLTQAIAKQNGLTQPIANSSPLTAAIEKQIALTADTIKQASLTQPISKSASITSSITKQSRLTTNTAKQKALTSSIAKSATLTGTITRQSGLTQSISRSGAICNEVIP